MNPADTPLIAYKTAVPLMKISSWCNFWPVKSSDFNCKETEIMARKIAFCLEKTWHLWRLFREKNQHGKISYKSGPILSHQRVTTLITIVISNPKIFITNLTGSISFSCIYVVNVLPNLSRMSVSKLLTRISYSNLFHSYLLYLSGDILIS